ncbi:MFS general substrate transporter [Lentinus tigrinus ALCF2SS1-6]|uniref:MFS general substrate transporter n=1 Tax=Lentinus tigrinus ALCF2SS1-6 TaxID=1328759 RepID=A0A5C2SC05_9APHY|nr:MFS general substrate transporter [Lentinus tigrinus ALCF2SS1-6]
MSVEEKQHASIEEKVSSVDVDDRAAVVPAHTPEEERRLVRKLDMRIMPMACIMYLFAYLDRTNLGNARLQGLPRDILHGDPTGVLFDWVNSAFFFSYILCQIPATVISKLFPPRTWLGCAAIGWGICSVLMSTAFNFAGLFVARVGLGVFEACFGPGIPLYMSFFYTKEEMGMRMAYWFGFAAVAGAFGGLIAFGVQHVHAAVANWKLLFIIEGLPTILIGLLSLVVLPNRPEETTIFTEKEREIALDRANRGIKADTGRVIKREHVIDAFKDWRIYAAGVMYFGANCALASISAFLPTIIKTFGYTDALAQLLTVPPYAVAAVFLCLNSYVSDRLQSRGPFVAYVSAVAAIGYVLLLAVPSNNHVRYFATFCIVSGTYTTIGVIIAWFAHNLGSETKKATGIPMYMAIGQCGSVLGSHLYPATEGPRYIKGFAVTCALQFLAALAAIVLTVSYHIENRRRDRKYGKPVPNATVDTTELADKAPDFRYVP